MQELYKGYLKTKNKVPIQKFKNTEDLLSKEEANKLSEYAGLLADNVALIDIDNFEESEKLMDIVEALQLNCKVVATTRGKHFYFYGLNHIEKCGTHLKLAIGLEADIKIGNHNSISILKFEGIEREVIYDIAPDESYEPVPAWLTPVKTKYDFKKLECGDGRNQTLFNYILQLQSADLNNDEIKETIKLINDFILPSKLDQEEVDKILRDEAFSKPTFYKNNTFLFNVFATYLKNNCHIIKLNGQLHIYKDGVYVDGLQNIETEMIKLIPTLTARHRAEVIKYLYLIAPDIKSSAGANYIAFNNGIYNLNTNQLEDFSPDIIVTNKIPHNYNYEAYSEVMDSVLDKISCHDDSIRDLLEEVAGYVFYRRNELRKAFIFIGDRANGKSTYLDAISYMVGEGNRTALDLKELGDRFRTAELFGKLICAGDDIGDEFIPNPAVFKKIVSGDPIMVERKGQDPFTLNNYSKPIFSANNIPRIKDKTGAVIDRLIIVPFNATFSKNDEDYDPYIKYKLRTEEAMEYLIQVALDGLKRVLKNNSFTMCEAVQNELNEYNEQNNPILSFLKELEPEADVNNQPTKDVYLRYKIYCSENGFTPMSAGEFSKIIKKEYSLDIKVVKINGRSVRIFVEEA